MSDETQYRARIMSRGLTMLSEIGQFLERLDVFSARLSPADAAALDDVAQPLRRLHSELTDRSTL